MSSETSSINSRAGKDDEYYESANEEFDDAMTDLPSSSLLKPDDSQRLRKIQSEINDEDSTPSLSNSGSSWLNNVWQSATATVTSLSSSVGGSVSVVMKAIDTGLGAPDPSQLAIAIRNIENKSNKLDDPSISAVEQMKNQNEKNTDCSTGPIDQVYIQQLTDLVDRMKISNAVNSGLEALETLGRLTTGTLRETHLRNTLRTRLFDRYISSNQTNISDTLSRLAARHFDSQITDQSCKIQKPKDDILQLIDSSNAADRYLKEIDPDKILECKRSLLLNIKEGSHDSNWSTFNEIFKAEWTRFDKEFEISTEYDLSKTLQHIDDNFTNLESDVEFDLKNAIELYDRTLELIQSMTCSLFNSIARLHVVDASNLTFISRLCSNLYESISICTEFYAILIRDKWTGDQFKALTDTLASLFFKSSDTETFVLEAYEHLQKCIIASVLTDCKDR